jgi:polysaccharide biosynthesis protein PslH
MAGRVLFLTHTTPLPLVSGERIRSFHLLRELARRDWRVSLFSLLHSVPLSPSDEQRLRELCDEVVLQPFSASPLVRYTRLLRALAASEAFHRRYFFGSGAARRIGSLLTDGRFDVVVAVTLYMYPYIPPERHHSTLLDSLNVEVRRLEGMAAALPRHPRGFVARRQLAPVRRYEAEVVRRIARVVAVSEEERAEFERLAPGKVDLVPNGVDTGAIRPRAVLPREPQLLFVGSMDYGANVDAVEHLVDDVLPLVRRRDATVTLVGSNPRRSLVRAATRSPLPVEVAGYVPSTAPYFERSRIFVVPLRYGGGTRLKILEALARGVPVLTTSVGCEGLRLRHGQELVVADDPGDFAAWIDRLLDDDELCDALAARGRERVESEYDWGAIGSAFAESLETVGRSR